MEILRVENLCKTYGKGKNEVKALDNVSFSVKKGEFIAIIGPSGSGKSTLLHILGGVDKPTSGKVFMDDRETHFASPFEASKAGIEAVHQELMLIPWEEASGKRLADVKAACPDARDIGILVGPEGGIAPEEIAQVECECVTLGPRILRTETAAVAALAIAMGLWGDV